MKLCEVKILTEAPGEYAVYSMTAPGSPETYYGYNKFDADAPISRTGLTPEQKLRRSIIASSRIGADGTDSEFKTRGTRNLIASAGGEDNVVITVLSTVKTEFDAFIERNDYRASEPDSISRPSNLPPGLYKRAMRDHPDKVAEWGIGAVDKDGKKIKHPSKMTAKEAYAAKLFTHADLLVSTAAGPKVKKELIRDLEKMMYYPFRDKWLSHLG